MKPCSASLAALLLIASLPVAAQELDRAGLRAPSSAGAAQGADLADAKRAFERGKRAFDAGRYEEAAERFQYAYDQSGMTDLLFNLGLALDRLREDERALVAFERYLELSEDDELRAQVEQRVAALRSARDRAQRADAERREEEARATVPSPAQVAASAQQRQPASGADRTGPADADPAEDDGSVVSSWWFWTGAALVLASGATVAFVLTRETDAEPPPRPNTGVTVTTLRLAP